jgi:hypothetical protein
VAVGSRVEEVWYLDSVGRLEDVVVLCLADSWPRRFGIWTLWFDWRQLGAQSYEVRRKSRWIEHGAAVSDI